MSILAAIQSAWGWIGIHVAEVVGENDFGNLIIKDTSGRYWRLCPEELSCEVVAETRSDLDRLAADQEFLRGWYLQPLVEQARETCGPLPEGRKYCLKIPSVLGGAYTPDNFGTITLLELIGGSGDIAEQIKDIPNGARIQPRTVK